MTKQQLIKQIEKEIEIAQAHIQTWEKNLERYRDYLKEITDQLTIIKLEIKSKNIEKK